MRKTTGLGWLPLHHSNQGTCGQHSQPAGDTALAAHAQALSSQPCWERLGGFHTEMLVLSQVPFSSFSPFSPGHTLQSSCHLWNLVLRKGSQSGRLCASQVALCAVPFLPPSWVQTLARQLVGNFRLK